jgi:hypothetical protein
LSFKTLDSRKIHNEYLNAKKLQDFINASILKSYYLQSKQSLK